MIEKIKKLPTSDGGEGWPVVVRDRISYPPREKEIITDAQVAVTFLWNMRDYVLPKLDKGNLAIATNFYTPSGLESMVRNILANPQIRYIILLGEEYSSKEEKGKSELTSANAIRAFFQKGIDNERKIPGFENSVYFDINIPAEMINKVRENVELIDLNKNMPNALMDEKIKEANRLLKILQKKDPFIENPLVFDYEKSSESFPYEGGPLAVSGSTIPDTWIKIMQRIDRYGKDNLMDANTDRWVKEINNIVAVVHEPQSMDLSVNPFLVPITHDKIKAYQQEVLSPLLPEGKAYTYGNKLRAYYCEGNAIKEFVSSGEFRDFEFGKGPHLEKNVKYTEKGCQIDQINDLVDVLKRNLYSKSALAITWHVQDELIRKHKSSPCLVLIQPVVQDEKLNLTVYFRSHDMVQGWPENAYGCAAIQKKMAEEIGVETGLLTIISCSAQIYKHYYAQIKEMLKKHLKSDAINNDQRGNFIIRTEKNRIILIHIHPETNRELDKIEGSSSKEIIEKLSLKAEINTPHAMYLGSELQKAEVAIKNGLIYEQDKELIIKK